MKDEYFLREFSSSIRLILKERLAVDDVTEQHMIFEYFLLRFRSSILFISKEKFVSDIVMEQRVENELVLPKFYLNILSFRERDLPVIT